MSTEAPASPAEPHLTDPESYVFIQRARCPQCGCADLQTIRSRTEADGTVERRTQCRVCFARFFVVVE